MNRRKKELSMNIPSGFRSCRFAAIVLLLMALATLPALADDTAAPDDQSTLQLGRVTILGPASCPTGVTQGATCTSVNVSCPKVPDLTAILSEPFPTVTAKGTIVLINGGVGPGFFNSG